MTVAKKTIRSTSIYFMASFLISNDPSNIEIMIYEELW